MNVSLYRCDRSGQPGIRKAISRNSEECCAWTKTRSHGNSGCAGSGSDGLARYERPLYLLGGRLASPLPPGDYGVSVITQMELLSWPSLTKEEAKRVNAFLSTLTFCDLTPAIRVRAVCLRREERLKLPDAIVCATALEHGVELWTNDVRLVKVSGLVCRSVSLAV